MSAFFDTVALAITPLTPVHIGCGQDFEPTNYVIDDGVLYHFDPARVPLSKADRDALISAVNRRGDEAIRDLQKFFHARKERFAGVAHGAVAVAAGVAEQYGRRIGQVAQHENGGRRVANQLEIERTAHHPHTGAPYIPGSSIKGAIRTAWLDQLNDGQGKSPGDRNAQDIEKRLLDSRAGFHADPFRLLQVADTCSTELDSKVVFATNHKKREVYDKDGRLVEAKGPATRREAIIGGQHRALRGEIRISTLPGIGAGSRAPGPGHRIPAFAALATACNRYYLRRMRALLDVLESRRLAAPQWLSELKKLLADLQPDLDSGHVMLLRIGRHSGAESVTLDGVRSIKIMKGRGQPPDWSPEGAKTVWLAAERDGERSGMVPFGWLIVEAANSVPIESLQHWCAAQPRTQMAEIRAQLASAQQRAAAETLRQHQLEAERQARAAAEAAAQAALEAARALLSAEGKLIDEFARSCRSKADNARKDPLNPGSGLYAEALRLSKAALRADSTWSTEDRMQLAEMLTEWLPKVVDKLDRKDEWKDARKKLQLAALRGE
ncbi:MAG: type III-A CRISPR-associated RAMP protein Csm5 [Proteobacteria bacterium]|nr:type III-A CRISPR-associated RAMP protein Csm5 [Pseudomonadota bacterium]